ncbi:asc-type amino acid transporter 1 isoform X2 [Heterocephalus glaber]|uniref:Asc-type amino acid transporter 1 isoform X2 n=1 Tax=Heterocephalus glaber TaxID=10181 RepID=A0AAX6RFW9_HETGA|nr:asc-type amino acid transporter 1 isoform X2 [Heterocephalus glaber]
MDGLEAGGTDAAAQGAGARRDGKMTTGHFQQPSGCRNPGPAPSPSPGPGPGPGASERVALKKEIGLVSACTIIIGNIIGSGIFISPKGVLEHSGSVGLALFVWVLGGGVTALGSLCYAELGVAIPKSGGDYAYVTEIFGGLAGFLLLWSAVLIMYPTSLAVISMTFSNYVLQPVFPNCIPPATASRALSMACLMLLTWVNSSSVRWATRIQDIFTGGKLLALSIIIGVGFVQIFQGHFEELRPSNAFAFWMTPSVGHLALAFLQGSFAFSGWNFLNYVTEELVDPRNRPPLLPVGTALERKMNADPVICIWPKLTHMHATWSLQLKPVTPSDAQPGVWTGNYCSQEPTSCHLHLYPSGDLCVHVHQCCLLHSHVPTGAAGLQRSGCDLRGEAAGLLFMGHACLRGTFHFWRDQWLPVHLFQAVLLWSPRGAPSQPAGHDPCQTLHPYPCPPRLLWGHSGHHACGRHIHTHQLRVLHQLPLLRRHHPGPAGAALEAAGTPQIHQGEPSHPCGILGVLGIPAGLQLHLGAHGLWGRHHHHPDRGPHFLPGSVLEKQTKVCAQTHRDQASRSICLSVLRVHDTLGPEAVFRGLSSGLP